MKKIGILIFSAVVLFSCSGISEEEHQKILSERDSLMGLASTKTGEVDELLKGYNEIQENLMAIKEKENIISEATQGKTELNQSSKDQIQEDIKMINELLEKNKSKINELNRKLSGSGKKMASLEKMIKNLEQQLIAKDEEITKLKDQVAYLNLEIELLTKTTDELKTANKEKTEIIERQTAEMNSAYYIVGTYTELRDKGVLTKEGGFIGIGKNKVLKDDFNTDAFTKIDITQTTSIKLGAKKAELVTNHTNGSYEIRGDKKAEELVITAPDQFWKNGKYCVILLK